MTGWATCETEGFRNLGKTDPTWMKREGLFDKFKKTNKRFCNRIFRNQGKSLGYSRGSDNVKEAMIYVGEGIEYSGLI